MKIFKKVLTICLIASMAVTAFGCSQNTETSSADSESDMPMETISLEKTKQPLTFVHDAEAANEEATEGGEAAETQAETATTAPAAETEAASAVAIMPVTEIVNVTDAKGQAATDAAGQPQTEVVNVTEYVKVTDAAGQSATNAEGQEQTEVVNVTETAVVTDAESPATLKPDEPNQPNQEVTENNNSSYTPSYDVNKAYWLDMSQSSDFFFEGEFLIYEFKIKEDAPDGVYPITFEKADIASWDVKTWTPKIITGEVAVNTTPTAQEDMPDDEFALKINSVSGKPGDTVTVTVDLKNNPGFCGFVINMKYDKGALELLNEEGGKDFNATAVNYIE
ncbi:MAG: hypothetical protein IKI37_03795 [Oscillospiraceae bacterium]|nr:hypothetical protein [Oscillospiraceae bacterium]